MNRQLAAFIVLAGSLIVPAGRIYAVNLIQKLPDPPIILAPTSPPYSSGVISSHALCADDQVLEKELRGLVSKSNMRDAAIKLVQIEQTTPTDTAITIFQKVLQDVPYEKASSLSDAIEKAISSKPNLVLCRICLLNLYVTSNRLDKGISLLDPILRNARKNEPALVWLVQMGLEYRPEMRRAMIEAKECLIYLSPYDSSYARSLARSYMDAGDRSNAVRMANQIVSMQPSDPNMLRCAADIFRRFGLNQQAIECFERSVKLDPWNSYAYKLEMARIYSDMGMIDEATELLQFLIDTTTDVSHKTYCLNDLVGINAKAGRMYKIAEALVLAEETGNGEYSSNVIISAWNSIPAMGRVPMATALSSAMKDRHGLVYCPILLAELYTSLGNTAEASSVINNLGDKIMDNPKLLGRLLSGDGIHSGKVRLVLLRRLRDLSPDDPEPAMKLALSLAETGQKDEALGVARSINEKWNSNPTAMHAVAEVFSHVGHWRDAIDTYKRCIKIDPQNAAYHKIGIAVVYKSEHMDRKAFDTLKAAFSVAQDVEAKDTCMYNLIPYCLKYGETKRVTDYLISREKYPHLEECGSQYYIFYDLSNALSTSETRVFARDLSKALEGRANLVYCRLLLVNLYLASGQMEKARVVANSLVKSNKTDFDVLEGLALLGEKHPALCYVAIEAYKRIDERNPGNYCYKIRLTKLYTRTGNASAAVNEARILIRDYPANLEAVIAAADVFEKFGEWEAAEHALRQTIDLAPHDVAPYKNRLDRIVKRLGWSDPREDDASSDTALQWTDQDIIRELFKAYISDGSPEKAAGMLVVFEQKSSEFDKNAVLGDIWLAIPADKKQAMIDPLKQAIKDKGDLFYCPLLLAQLYIDLNQAQNAKAVLEGTVKYAVGNRLKLDKLMSVCKRDPWIMKPIIADVCKQLIALDPNNIGNYESLILAYRDVYNKDEALKAARMVISKWPGNAQIIEACIPIFRMYSAWDDLADAYRQKLKSGMQLPFNEAIEWAVACKKSGRLDESIAVYRMLLADANNDDAKFNYYIGIAEIFARKQMYNELAKTMIESEQGCHNVPHLAWPEDSPKIDYNLLANALAIELNGKDGLIESRRMLMHAYCYSNQPEKALPCATALRRDASGNDSILYDIAASSAHSDKLRPLGIEICKEALSRNPEDYRYVSCLMYIYDASGMTKEAMDEAQKLINSHSTKVDPYLSVIGLYQRHQMKKESIEVYKLALSVDPDSKWNKECLARLYSELEMYTESADIYRELLANSKDIYSEMQYRADLKAAEYKILVSSKKYEDAAKELIEREKSGDWYS